MVLFSILPEKRALEPYLSSRMISQKQDGSSRKTNVNGSQPTSRVDKRYTRAVSREIANAQSQEWPLSRRWQKSEEESLIRAPTQQESMRSHTLPLGDTNSFG
ncbi:hypothetical protein Y032_0322g2445 [Ancylostoma ceylanicum]|nr:hypothetical protein Y032_0322g2445 [Ancylostoma ceylanicum]